MPGPLGEKCGTCYCWDRDNRERDTGSAKNAMHFRAECCFGAPSDRGEILFPRDDEWCTEYESVDDGKAWRLAGEDDSEIPDDPPLEGV